jgi:hypothetical protein
MAALILGEERFESIATVLKVLAKAVSRTLVVTVHICF